MLQQAVSNVNIERSKTALHIAKDMMYCYTDLYKQSGVRVSKRTFINLFVEVAYDVLGVPKMSSSFSSIDKNRYITVLTNKLKAMGYTFFLRDDTNRLAVLMHIKMMCKEG